MPRVVICTGVRACSNGVPAPLNSGASKPGGRPLRPRLERPHAVSRLWPKLDTNQRIILPCRREKVGWEFYQSHGEPDTYRRLSRVGVPRVPFVYCSGSQNPSLELSWCCWLTVLLREQPLNLRQFVSCPCLRFEAPSGLTGQAVAFNRWWRPLSPRLCRFSRVGSQPCTLAYPKRDHSGKNGGLAELVNTARRVDCPKPTRAGMYCAWRAIHEAVGYFLREVVLPSLNNVDGGIKLFRPSKPTVIHPSSGARGELAREANLSSECGA
jgi:hypothetical protein